MLATGSAWLEAQRTAYLSTEVIYDRSGVQVTLSATVGRTEFEQTDDYGIVHRLESRDFLIIAADLVLSGELTTPQSGDLIRETAGTGSVIYEVMAPGGEPPWRYSDLYRTTLRIHTKQVDTT